MDYIPGYIIKICVLYVVHVRGQKNRSVAGKTNLKKFIFNLFDVKIVDTFFFLLLTFSIIKFTNTN